MSYTPTNWKAGDTVTSAKLNKMEQGIASSNGTSNVLMVEMTKNENEQAYESIMEAADIGAAFISGKTVIVHFPPWSDTKPDVYAQLVYYAPAPSNPNSQWINPCFNFVTTSEYSGDRYDLFDLFNTPVVENGKLMLYLMD